ncbi:hypothetical protein [Thermoanaerobacterium sp. DL9XJH110]|uniref:hypothetical protein n=1 Tax=Thermoanaerobacterium sp. DL9XJH110 TaxID=3386643 RepID=UPI003BB4C0A0
MDIRSAEKEYKTLLESELERITAELKQLGTEKILLFGWRKVWKVVYTRRLLYSYKISQTACRIVSTQRYTIGK